MFPISKICFLNLCIYMVLADHNKSQLYVGVNADNGFKYMHGFK